MFEVEKQVATPALALRDTAVFDVGVGVRRGGSGDNADGSVSGVRGGAGRGNADGLVGGSGSGSEGRMHGGGGRNKEGGGRGRRHEYVGNGNGDNGSGGGDDARTHDGDGTGVVASMARGGEPPQVTIDLGKSLREVEHMQKDPALVLTASNPPRSHKCQGNMQELYSAAWLTSAKTVASVAYEPYRLEKHGTNMEGACYLIMPNREKIKSADMLDFFIEHLS